MCIRRQSASHSVGIPSDKHRIGWMFLLWNVWHQKGFRFWSLGCMHGLSVEHKMLQSLKLFEQFIMFALRNNLDFRALQILGFCIRHGQPVAGKYNVYWRKKKSCLSKLPQKWHRQGHLNSSYGRHWAPVHCGTISRGQVYVLSKSPRRQEELKEFKQ